MTQITVLPHPEICPEGATINAEAGKSICENLLKNGVEIEHACEMSCACSTCHVIIKAGGADLNESDELEDDLLDQAWGLQPTSRLACQAIVGNSPITLEIPRYTINHAKEK